MPSQKFKIKNAQGEQLHATLDLPENSEPKAYAIFAHCFTCSSNFKAVSHITRSMTATNLAVLRFDFTGLGASEGEFAETNFSSNSDDLVAVAQYLEENNQSPKLLVGHSLGGAAVLHAANRIPSVKAVATLNAPSDPTHVENLFKDSKEEICKNGEAEISLAGRPFKIKKQFIDDLSSAHIRKKITSLDAALLILHAPLDNTVGIENAAELFAAARHPKSFIALEGADHLLSKPENSQYAGTMIAAWAQKYIT